MAAINAETGMVNTHAHKRLTVTPHRTAETLLVTPTPMIEPVIV
jgi:hypothetical protein